MSFADDVHHFTTKVERLMPATFANVASAMHGSIVNGSPLTGAPGQPVDTGALKASWQLEFLTPTSARISTNSPYALPNEDGIRSDGRPYRLRSPVGGRHSVKLTLANAQRIVDDEARKANGGGANV